MCSFNPTLVVPPVEQSSKHLPQLEGHQARYGSPGSIIIALPDDDAEADMYVKYVIYNLSI